MNGRDSEDPTVPKEGRCHHRPRLQGVGSQLCKVSVHIEMTMVDKRTSRAPSNNVDGLRMFDEGREVGDFTLLTSRVDVPELRESVRAGPRLLFCRIITRTLLSPPAVAKRPLL